VHRQSFQLDSFFQKPLDPLQHNLRDSEKHPYQIERSNGHFYYFYPPGTPVLCSLTVPLFNAIGLTTMSSPGEYNLAAERRMQRACAGILMAGLVCLIFHLARLMLPIRWSLGIALASGLGTPILSTTSRGLWSDCIGIVLLTVMIHQLLRVEIEGAMPRPLLYGTYLSWMFFVRPTYAIPILCFVVYFALFHRRVLPRLLAVGSCWLLVFVAYSWQLHGRLLPSQYLVGNDLNPKQFGAGLAGLLFSPSRGLIVFVPLTLVVGYCLVRYRRYIPYPRLAALALCASGLLVGLVSLWPNWWGGYSYGPRLLCGVIPWLVLLGILAIKGMLVAERGGRSFKAVRVAASILLLLGALIHLRGAADERTWEWNYSLTRSAAECERIVWDWKNPQFAAGLFSANSRERRYHVASP